MLNYALQTHSDDIDYLDEYILPIAEESHMASFLDALLAEYGNECEMSQRSSDPKLYSKLNN